MTASDHAPTRFTLYILAAIFVTVLCVGILMLISNHSDSESVGSDGLPKTVLGKPLVKTSTQMVCKSGMIAEVFAYQCPHCWKLEEYIPVIERNASIFIKVPTDLGRANYTSYLKMNYAVDMLRMNPALKHEAMRLYHEDAKQFDGDKAVKRWLALHGADKDELDQLFQSQELLARLQVGRNFVQQAGITGVPSIIVNGRYITSPAHAGGYDKLEAQIQELQKLPHNCQA